MNGEVATAKVLDGEAIVINVVTGRYYSLEGTAAFAWCMLSAGATTDETAGALAGVYGADPVAIAADVERLAAELAGEDLIVTAGDGASAPAPPEAPAGDYAAPQLVAFTDLEDLLAFDPPLPPTDAELWPTRVENT